MIIVLLGVAIIVNFLRFYIRGIEPSSFMHDFKLVYTACAAFAKGENPYNRIDLEKVWQKIPDREKIIVGSTLSSGPFMYPPFVLLLFQPTVVIKWNIAAYLMFGLDIVLVLGIIILLGLLGNFVHLKYEMALCLLLITALKTSHLGLIVGQPFFFSFFFALLSIYFAKKGKYNLSVVTLSLSFIKPTVALPFFLYFFFKREYRVCIYTVCLVLCSNLIIIPFMPLDAIWTYFREVALSFEPGHINDYTPLNSSFYDITDIQTLLYLCLNSRIVVTIVKYAIAGLLIVFFLNKKKNFTNVPYNIIVFFTFFSLFFIYHRFIDTITLIVVLITLRPTQLFQSLGWRILLLVPLLFPVTGLVIILKSLLPSVVYHVAALNIQVSLTILFIFWIVMVHQNVQNGNGIVIKKISVP